MFVTPDLGEQGASGPLVGKQDRFSSNEADLTIAEKSVLHFMETLRCINALVFVDENDCCE